MITIVAREECGRGVPLDGVQRIVCVGGVIAVVGVIIVAGLRRRPRREPLLGNGDKNLPVTIEGEPEKCFSGPEWIWAKKDLEQDKRWNCIENYLASYADLAQAEKIPQENLDNLFNKTRDFINILKVREDYWLSVPPQKVNEATRKAQKEFQVLLEKLRIAKTRLDKLVVIESFMHLTHAGGGVLLPRACDLPGIGYEIAVEEVLNCLSNKR